MPEAEAAILAGLVGLVGETAGQVLEAVPVGETAGQVVEAVPVGETAGLAVEAVAVAQVGSTADLVTAEAEGSVYPESRAWCRIAGSSTDPSAMNGATTAELAVGAPLAPNGQGVLREARPRELPV